MTINKPRNSNLYVTAGTVTINAPIFGDLIVTGGSVNINDTISQDVLIFGGRVLLNGVVSGDVRCIGGEIIINKAIAGDLLAAGGIVEIENTATIGSIAVTGGNVTFKGRCINDLNVAAGKFLLAGNVGGNVTSKGGTLFIEGNIKGKASLAASEDIIFSDAARIGRGIRYWLPFHAPLKIPAGVSSSAPSYDELLSITHSRWYFLGASTFLGLMWYLGMAYILILLLQYLFATTFYRAGIKVHAKPFKSFLTGLAYFVGVPILSILLLATIIGLPLTLIVSFFYIASVLMATVISSVVIVNWVSFFSDREYSLIKMSGMGIGTFALLKILTFTPFFGSFLMIVIAATAFGALMMSIRWKPITINTDIRQPATSFSHLS